MPLSGGGGGGGLAGAVRAGSAYVELFARDKIGGVLDRIAARMKAFGGTLLKAGAGMTAAGLAGLTAVGGIFRSVTTRGQEVERLAQSLGTTAETVTRLGYAFETAGVGFDQFGERAKDLQAKLADGADQLREFGLDARALAALPVGEQLAALADHLRRLQTQDQFSLAEKLGVKELLPVLQKGSGELARLAAEADALGYTMSGKTAAAAADVGRAFDRTWAAIKVAVMEVGAALLPQADQIKEFATFIRTAAVSVREWVADNKELVTAVVAGAAALTAAGVAVTAFGLALKGAAAAVAVVSLAVKALGLAVALLSNPVGLAVAAIGALGVVFATQTEAGRGFVGSMKAGFREFADTAKKTWGGVSAAMRKGDFQLAAEIAFAGITLEWRKIEKWWTVAWNKFKGVFVDGWHALGTALKLVFTDIGAWVLRNTLGTLNDLIKALSNAARRIGLGEVAARLDAAAAKVLSDEEINKAREDVKAEDRRDAAARQTARDAARRLDEANAEAAVQAARANLDRLIARANAAEAKAGPPPAVAAARAALPDVPRLFEAVRGGFAGARAEGQFGYGTKTAEMRQLRAAEQVARNTAPLPEIRQAVRDLADGLTFA